jgi:diaminopimelate epimerase
MRFEKWNALGNDYAIFEAKDLPFDLTPARIRALCALHSGIGSDGILLLSEPTQRGFVAHLKIFNPDGSEAELSGNGSREAILYLRQRGWTDQDEFSIETAAGEIRPHITGPTTCRVDMGRAQSRGGGTLESAGREFSYEDLQVGNPQCAVELPADENLAEFDLVRYGAPIESNTDLFPNRTNVSFWQRIGDNAIRARIFERGVGETLSSGTGASGAAVAFVLRGGDSPVTVHLDGGDLEVEVGEDLHVDLTGWAVPVYSGTIAPELVKELSEIE